MTRKLLLLVSVLSLIGLTPVWASGATTVTVVEESVVKGPVITLGEIAEISGADAERVQYLRQIKLGAAPPPGQRVVLTREQLRVRLLAAQADYSGIVWEVPLGFQVTTGSQVLTGDKLLETAIERLKEKLTTDGAEDIKITVLNDTADLLAPAGDLTFDVQVPLQIRYSTPMSFYLMIQHEGVLYHRIPIKCTIQKFAEVVVATQPVTAREVLTAEKVRLERLDVGRLTTGYITNIEEVIGLAAKRSFAAGTVLNDSFLDQPILVKRNSMVTIVGRTAGIEVTAMGMALQDGRTGQIIQVRNISSRRIIAAKVVSPTMVQVLTYQTN